MRLLVLRSGIKEDTYNQLIEHAKTLTDEYLSSLYNELYSIYENEWRTTYNVWVLPAISNPEKAEQIWNNYDMMEITGTPEQDLLRDAMTDLRDKLKRTMKKWLKRN